MKLVRKCKINVSDIEFEGEMSIESSSTGTDVLIWTNGSSDCVTLAYMTKRTNHIV
jgi:hypothetical protein